MSNYKSAIGFRFHKMSIAVLAWMLIGNSQGAEGQPDIKSLMTSEERRATGIELLNDAQIDELNAWLERYSNGDINVAPGSTNINSNQTDDNLPAEASDVYPPPRQRVDIHSRITGDFEGWEGQTRFTLDNGQVWEQRRRGRWKTSLNNPEVRLYQNFLGAWELEVVAEGRSIGVRRVR